MRFVATADWQLGMAARYLDDDARPRYIQARFDAISRIAEAARESNAQFVVVGGDVFESNQLDRSIIARAFEALRAFKIPVVLVPGNHDPLDASAIYDSPLFTSRKPDHVIVVRDNHPLEVVPGVEVVGAPWFSKRPTGDLVAQAIAELDEPSPGTVRIVVGHGAVSTLNPDRDSVATIDVEALRDALARGLAHMVILGDRHGTFEVTPQIWYPGTPEVTDRREIDPGNVLIIDNDEASGAWSVDKVHVGTWRFLTLRRELNSRAEVAAFGRELDEFSAKDRTAIWLGLSGTLSTAAKAELDAVIARAAEVFARIEHWERHSDLAVIPDDHDFTDLSLGGYAQHALDELVERATAGLPSGATGIDHDRAGASGIDHDRAGATGNGDEDYSQEPHEPAHPDVQAAQDALSLLYRLAGAHR